MTKRKGKPKTKTKLLHGDARMSTETQFAQSKLTQAAAAPSAQAGNVAQLGNRPIISISAEPDRSRSSSALGDVIKSSLDSSSSSSSSSTSSSSSASSSSSSSSSSSDCQQQVSLKSVSDSQLDIAHGILFAHERGAKKRRPSSPPNERSNGTANVEANFIGLMRYNKLQYFYIGALIFSVMNLMLSVQFLVHQQPEQPIQLKAARTRDTNQHKLAPDSHEISKRLLHILWTRSIILSSAMQSGESLMATALDGQANGGYEDHESGRDSKYSVFIILLILLPLSVIMFLVIMLTMIEFNSIKWHTLSASSKSKLQSYLESFGSLLATILLTWPIYMQLITNNSKQQGVNLIGWFGTYRHWLQTVSVVYKQPINAIIVTLYSMFALLDGTAWPTKALCALWLSPIVVMVVSMITFQIQEFSYSCSLLVIAFLAGLVRRRQLASARTKTIAGSSELIGAKVSLEQQRQQQETLLLSVLPAYVAEQVKRNMVKKMTSVDAIDCTLQAATAADFQGSPQQQQQQQQTIATLTVGSGGAGTGKQRVSTQIGLTGDEAPKFGGASQQTKRNSLVKCSKSGASYLTEAIISGTNALKPGPADKSCAHAVASAHLPSPSFYPTSNFTQPPSQARRGFNELYIRTYNNVSLLYGDIVGFTRLCTQLSSSQLVRVLNDLFSHFDHLAEQHKIMRIKILGDCYYGVSGIPEFAVLGAKRKGASHIAGGHNLKGLAASSDRHAINCVNMGLDMIQYIRCLNVERADQQSGCSPPSASVVGASELRHSASVANCNRRQTPTPSEAANLRRVAKSVRSTSPEPCRESNVSNLPAFELNMRIGVHTGHIHSGVIGLKKWQFDVWSNDVSIAMHCESSGVAGRVQVTEATVQHLHGEFTYEPAPRSQRDSYLADKEIRTYLVREHAARHTSPNKTATIGQSSCLQMPPSKEAGGQARLADDVKSFKSNNHQKQQQQAINCDMDEDKIRAATIGTIKQILLAGETANSSSMNAYALALEHQDLKPIFLNFRDSFQEKMFACRLIRRGRFVAAIMLLLALIYSVYQIQQTWPHVSISSSRVQWICASLAGFLVLLVAISPIRCQKLVGPLRALAGEAMLKQSQRSPSSRRSNLSNPNDCYQNNLQNCDPLEELHRVEASETTINLRIRKCCAFGTKQLGKLNVKLKKLWCAFAATKIARANSNTRTCLVVLIFMLVILGQLHFSVANICTRSKLSTDMLLAVLFGQQATVILTLISIDLISSNLLNYRWKFTLILANSLLYLISTIKIILDIQQLTSATSSANSDGILDTRPLICAQFLKIFQTEPWPAQVGANPNLTKVERVHTNNEHGDGELFCLNLWSNSLLILVLAFWSLNIERQIEYALRCNFLWRNRLSVDHEELEYISGINKVLLENILPSHVVQHYLTQPTNGGASAALRKQAASPFEGHQARKRPSCRATEHLPSASTTSSNVQQRVVRMSISQMRSLNSGQLASSDCELYHEQHDSVAVMFASIPHFYEFYDESDISKQGLGCIALLNEIICDFDKLLLKNKFSRIEKIKTIGSTYMAAAGLRPVAPPYAGGSHANLNYLAARNSTASQLSGCSSPLPLASGVTYQADGATNTLSASNSNNNNNNNSQHQMLANGNELSNHRAADLSSTPLTTGQLDQRRFAISQQKMNLICMIQFATSLMSTLNGINKQSFQVFKLRVGVNTGPVIAGIIGAQRPFYDIWGDCVNIASRMESLGEIGRIQVEEKTARLLMECLCTDTYSIERRGPIDVKGKGGMVTYFVDKKQQQQQQQVATSSGGTQISNSLQSRAQQQSNVGNNGSSFNCKGAAQAG